MQDLKLKNGMIIPEDELEIKASHAGGPGGQHVNKSNTRITVRWNIKNTRILTEEQKEQVESKLKNTLTEGGELIVHSAFSRSQLQNKEDALNRLADKVCKALYVPKRRMKTRMSKSQKDARLQAKSHRSNIKKLRGDLTGE